MLKLILILLVALVLRVFALSSYPVGFTPDEASFGYDAYSLLKTGRDQWGNVFPLSFESFGDYKLPLYGYLAIPFVWIFGLNEFAVRLPNALFGVFAVLSTYLLVKELFKKESFALLSALFLALSPWHLPLSRGAFEANLTTFLLPLGIWLFLKGYKNQKVLVLSAIILGLNLFSYHTARFITPLIFGFLIWLKYSEYKTRINLPLLIFGCFLALAFSTMFLGGGARGGDIAIFNPTDNWSAVADRRYTAVLVNEPDSIARLFSNKITYTFDQFVKNYVSYFSPQFLFTQGAGEWTYGMIPGQGVLYLIEILFLSTALFTLIKKREWKLFLLLIFWILVSPLPAALTKGPGFAANRVAIMMPAMQIISAYGALLLFDVLKRKIPLKLLISCAYILGVIAFLENYLFHSPIDAAPSMLYGRREAIQSVVAQENNFDKAIISRSLSEPHIYVAFYKQWDPEDYQRQSQEWKVYKEQGLKFVDQIGEYHLGKYTFKGIHIESQKGENFLYVGKPEEFPSWVSPLNKVNYLNGKPALFVVNSQNTNENNQ